MGGELTLKQAAELADAIVWRRSAILGESLFDSVMVVLLNAGDRFTPVSCMAGEWSGLKGDLPRGPGIPKCPNGHVLMEASSGRKQLGYVDADGA